MVSQTSGESSSAARNNKQRVSYMEIEDDYDDLHDEAESFLPATGKGGKSTTTRHSSTSTSRIKKFCCIGLFLITALFFLWRSELFESKLKVEDVEQKDDTTEGMQDNWQQEVTTTTEQPIVSQETTTATPTGIVNNNDDGTTVVSTTPAPTTSPVSLSTNPPTMLPTISPTATKAELPNDETDNTETTTTTTAETTTQPTSSPTISQTIAPTTAIAPPLSNDDLPIGYKKHPAKLSDTYLRRGKSLSDQERKEITDKWGSWTFVDTKKDQRPPLPQVFPNNDIPRESFPDGSWQVDKEYLSKWLPEAIALTERALEGMLGEYGHSKFDEPEKNFNERAFMYSLNMENDRKQGAKTSFNFKHPPGNAGYGDNKALLGIRRRALHSIITQSTFNYVMGGHSAAAGHGNHLQQSYSLQVQRVLEPIFARLGVYMQGHNFGMGGLGTVQNGLATYNMYGSEIDIIHWDSGMTEGDGQSKDVFIRSSILGGNKVPVVWGEPDGFNVYDFGFISTGAWFAGMAGVQETETVDQAINIPYAARFLNCGHEANQYCKSHRYNSSCWIDGWNDITPPTKQRPEPAGQASWHPGNRVHQLNGRLIAFQVVKQLYEGLKKWYNTPDYAIPDEDWHVTSDYEDKRNKVANTADSICFNWGLSDLFCTERIYARSEMLPRYNPGETSIRSIMKEGVKIDDPRPNLYDPPDPHLDAFDAPAGEVDILSILENGIDFEPNKARREYVAGQRNPLRHLSHQEKKPITSGLEPGQGFALNTQSAPDNCDGSYDSFCGHSADSDCLLSGHNDNRGGIMMDGYSGWFIVNLEKMKHGLIALRIEDWYGEGSNRATLGWQCENNKDCGGGSGGGGKDLLIRQRDLKEERDPICETFQFEFSIDGKKTTWNKKDWNDQRKKVQRVVDIWQLLNTRNYNDGVEKDVELAFRTTGCDRRTVLHFSHIYWA